MQWWKTQRRPSERKREVRAENVVGPDSVLGVSTPPWMWGRLWFTLCPAVWQDTPSDSLTLHNALTVTEWNQHAGLWSQNYISYARIKPFFSSGYIFRRGNTMSHALVSRLSFFRVKTWPHACSRGRGRSVATTHFFRSKHKSTNHMPVKLLRKTNGKARSTNSPLSCFHCWSVLEKPESSRITQTVVILSDMPSVVCTILMMIPWNIFSRLAGPGWLY